MVCTGNKVFKVQADTDRCPATLIGTGSGAGSRRLQQELKSVLGGGKGTIFRSQYIVAYAVPVTHTT